MKKFGIYKAVYRAGRPLFEALPEGGLKVRIQSALRRAVPDNRTLLGGAVSPLAFEIDGERFLLAFRTDDEGDLGIVKCLLRGGLYEPEVIACLRDILRPGRSFIDGGAHIGYVSLAASRFVGPAGKVYGFEPFPDSFRLLRDNIAANGRTAAISAHPQALWKGRETLTLSAPKACSVSVKWEEAPGPAGADRIEAEAIDLDGFCRALKVAPDLIKLDIEGAEPEALAGGLGIIRERRPPFILELNANHYRERKLSLAEYLDVLLNNGYEKCYILTSRSDDRKEVRLPRGFPELEKRLRRKHLNCLFKT